MPSSATDLLRLQKMATGEKVNTWGSEMNDTVIELVEDAIAGWENIAVTGNVTLTSTNYVADQARKSMINLTGTPGAGFNVTIPGSSKWYWFRNATGQTATITAGGVTCEVYDGEVIGVLTDGTDCYRVERNAFAQELDMKSNKIVNLDTPTASGDAVNKAYADTVITTAQTHATNAANSATAAAASETAAAASETAAAASETAAAASASAASTSETNASTSETNAAASASAASTSETNAGTSATAAAASASAASTSETNAAASASAASTSATNAATSESNASTSESNAATSASNAATSETNAAASYDSFDDRYLGSKVSDPTLDNDGDALLTGALYWNSTDNTFRAYNGSAWEVFGTGTVSTLDEIAEANLDTALQAKVNRAAPNKFDATTAPTANWDSADTAAVGTAFAEGSVVIDTVANEAYRCVDATATAAIWINTTLTTGELGTIATQNANAVAITGGTITGITDLAVADGGTGASTPAAARTNLGLAIGSDVLAYNAYANALDQHLRTSDSPTLAGLTVTDANVSTQTTVSNTHADGTADLQLATTAANSSANLSLVNSTGSPYLHLQSGTAVTAYYRDFDNHYFRNTAGSNLLAVSASDLNYYGAGTGAFGVEIGAGRTGDGDTYVDIVGDTTYTDYGARLIRKSGANGNTELHHRGTGTLTLWAADAAAITFGNNGTESVRIDNSGNVGINSTSPSAYGKLTVEGNAVVGNPLRNVTATYSIGPKTSNDPADDTRAQIDFELTAGASSSSSAISFKTNEYGVSAGTRMHIDKSGNVGINEIIPDYKLDVNGDFGFTPGTSVTPVDNGDVVFEFTNNTTLTVRAKGTDGIVRSGTVTLA